MEQRSFAGQLKHLSTLLITRNITTALEFWSTHTVNTEKTWLTDTRPKELLTLGTMKKTYVYGSEDIYNHFTAMIWNSVNSVGCAYKRCPNDALYIICSYDPPGNIVGYSSENVFPLKVVT